MTNNMKIVWSGKVYRRTNRYNVTPSTMFVRFRRNADGTITAFADYHAGESSGFPEALTDAMTTEAARVYWKRLMAGDRYERGYRDGFEGKGYQGVSTAYADGHDAGTCDRPTLEESLGVDVAKERTWPLSF